jgi:hypothetical protein
VESAVHALLRWMRNTTHDIAADITLTSDVSSWVSCQVLSRLLSPPTSLLTAIYEVTIANGTVRVGFRVSSARLACVNLVSLEHDVDAWPATLDSLRTSIPYTPHP